MDNMKQEYIDNIVAELSTESAQFVEFMLNYIIAMKKD